MEAARTVNMPALLVAIALFAFCAATVVFQQMAISKTVAARENEEAAAESGATFPPTGETMLSSVVSSCQVELDHGSVDFKVADSGPGRVSWEVKERAGAEAQHLELQVHAAEGVLEIEDVWHGKRRAKRPDLRVTVWLPVTTDLAVVLGNGDLATALDGRLNAALGNGGVALTGAHSALEVSVGNGQVQGTARLNQGENSVHLGNGAVDLQLLPGSDAKLQVNTGLGEVQATGLPGKVQKHDWAGGSYNGQVGAGTARLIVEVGHGDVQLSNAGK
jgi:hypothetical protein